MLSSTGKASVSASFKIAVVRFLITSFFEAASFGLVTVPITGVPTVWSSSLRFNVTFFALPKMAEELDLRFGI